MMIFKLRRPIAIVLVLMMLYQVFFPTVAYALGGGPSQPEVESFEPVGTSEMVDLFSGDFNYNIPLLDVDGYPVNIAYHSGITTDQEASWVGLGWNINAGVINRNMRGLPDDFSGDQIKKNVYVKPDITFGLKPSVRFEVFGKGTSKASKWLSKIGGSSTLTLGFGISYNNYKGLGIESFVTPAINAGNVFKNPYLKNMGLNGSLTLASSSQDGFTISPHVGMSYKMKSKDYQEGTMTTSANVSVGMSMNSRSGIRSLTFQKGVKAEFSRASWNKQKDGSYEKGKKTTASMSVANGGSTVSFGTQTYNPSIGMAMENVNLSLMVGIGPDFWAMHPQFSAQGYYAEQAIANTQPSPEAFGYLYSEKRSSNTALLDFNREKDGSFSDQSPALGIPVSTYDLYSVSGQGVSGLFRPYRSDAENYSDAKTENISNGGSLGVEVGIGNLYKVGVNAMYNYSNVSSGTWEDDNNLGKKMRFKGKNITQDPSLYEPYYFKNVGEKATVESNLVAYTELGTVLRPKLEDKDAGILSHEYYTSDSKLQKLYNYNDYADVDLSSLSLKFNRTQREKRNQAMSVLTVAERNMCLNPIIPYTNVDGTTGAMARNTIGHENQHITEVTVSKADGMRYVYGVPAYNQLQEEYNFTNATPDILDELPPALCYTNGLVEYPKTFKAFDETDNDPSDANYEARAFGGNDKHFSKTKTPPYAHSYLLTAVLSADYADRTGNGLSDDDLGQYTSIGYYKVHSNYKWRVPYQKDQASYNQGYKSDYTDDAASITYGEKEVWLMRKIEGKSHTAIFHISERTDGYAVGGRRGGKSSEFSDYGKSYKLDSIVLWNKALSKRIKTVHFEYDYTLCNGTENAISGKLTLKKLYFTYGASTKGQFNAYDFTYNEQIDAHQIKYFTKAYDRWGNYKPNNSVDASDVPIIGCTSSESLTSTSNSEYPYVDQDKVKTDKYASAWSLKKITLPSGGYIDITYEADDYAYVQNKRAMQMAKIIGVGKNSSFSSVDPKASSKLFDYTDMFTPPSADVRDYIFFDLPAGSPTNSAEFKKYILEGNDNTLYFNCLVDLTDKGDYEYVRGYTKIVNAGVDGTKGWVEIEKVDDGENNPISKAAWQMARMSLPWLVYPGSNLRKNASGSSVAESIMRGLLGFVFEAKDMIQGFNDKLRSQKYGQNINLDKSWIRINNMNGAKLGGGCRVKEIALSDNWYNMSTSTGRESISYGQQYKYTTQEYYNGEMREISSGVASYEPINGNDENPFRMPVSYSKENWLVPDDEFYAEEPFGEAYFPAPGIGYSRVTVRNLDRNDPTNSISVKKHATGKVVNEFYTAKEFPLFTKRTDVNAKSASPSTIFSLLGFMSENYMTMSQGFQIELNDMHGKPKAVWNYSEVNVESDDSKDAFSGIKYEYLVEDANAGVKKLSNTVSVIDKYNSITQQTVGVDAEIIADSREHSSMSFSGGIQGNLECFIPVIPFPVPVITFFAWPDISSEKSKFRSAVTMRVVNRFGILKKTTVVEEGANITTENLLLDGETGEVILTRTENEFRDGIYNTTFPAHWVYDGMGQAYKNIGMEATIKTGSSPIHQFTMKMGGSFVTVPATGYFVPGDEIRLVRSSDGAEQKCWVYKDPSDKWLLINVLGDQPSIITANTEYTAKVIRSGRRNQQNTSIASITSMINPMGTTRLYHDKTGADIDDPNKDYKIIQASASQYNEKWRVPYPLTKNCTTIDVKEELFNIFYASFSYYGMRANGTYTIEDFYNTYNGSNIYNVRERYGLPHEYTVSDAGLLYTITIDLPCTQEFVLISFPKSDLVGVSSMMYNGSTGVTSANILVNGSYNIVGNFEPGTITKCEYVAPENIIVNPYTTGILGNWRKQKDFVYFDNRSPDVSTTTNIRRDGAYKSFTRFWDWKSSYAGNAWAQNVTSRWIAQNEILRYSGFGAPLESKDALGRYSTQVFSNRNKQPLLVANNAAFGKTGSYDMESYTPTTSVYPYGASDSPIEQLDLQNNSCVMVSGEYAHSGKNSLKIPITAKYRSVGIIRPVYDETVDANTNNGFYTMDPIDFLGLYNPYTLSSYEQYIVSAWVKVGTDPKVILSPSTGAGIAVKQSTSYGNIVQTDFFQPSGPVIEGWQRVEGVVWILSGIQNTHLEMVASGTYDTWFDDLRIYPKDATIKTYVYDTKDHKMLAELDENNYATFYEYNEEGKLVRVKKETEKGIVTLKESRSSTLKSQHGLITY